MATTIAVSPATQRALQHIKEAEGLRSLDEAVGQLMQAGAHTIERLMTHRGDPVREACAGLGITRLVAFGSRVWGAAHPTSDVDLVAEFRRAPSLFDLVRAGDALSEAFGAKVDLTTWGALRPRLAERVRREGVTIVG